MGNGTLTRSFLTKWKLLTYLRSATDIETYLMWGHGGRLSKMVQMICVISRSLETIR
jgi:hypothetical protein